MKGTIVFTSVALAGLAAAPFHPFFGPFAGGFSPFFLLIPLFWIVVVGLIIGFAVRGRRRFWAHGGYGAYGRGPWGQGAWGQNAAAQSAEGVLAQRFANGDIDEKEYRARLEVLRASSPLPFQPPQK